MTNITSLITHDLTPTPVVAYRRESPTGCLPQSQNGPNKAEINHFGFRENPQAFASVGVGQAQNRPSDESEVNPFWALGCDVKTHTVLHQIGAAGLAIGTMGGGSGWEIRRIMSGIQQYPDMVAKWS